MITHGLMACLLGFGSVLGFMFNNIQHNPRLQGWQIFFGGFPGSYQKIIMGENEPPGCSSEPMVIFCGFKSSAFRAARYYLSTIMSKRAFEETVPTGHIPLAPMGELCYFSPP